MNRPTGPCSGTANFTVGPRLPRASTTSPTIAWALANSDARNVCSLVIEVQPGTYSEPLTITRDTTITNSPPDQRPVITGSITGDGHVLTLKSLVLRDTAAPGAIVLNGGGHSLADGGLTILQDITIDGASERGIALKGGTIKATNCEILNTKGSSSRPGVAIDVSFTGSASLATLENVRLNGNQGWGIVAAGSRNIIVARRLTVLGTKSVPLANIRNNLPIRPDQISNGRAITALPGRAGRTETANASDSGAIRISSGAALYAKNLEIGQNDRIGVLVDLGGIANIQDSTFAGTLATGNDPLNGGGNNIIVRADSILELSNFRSMDGARAGLEIAGGWIKATNGVLTSNEFGVDISSRATGWRRGDCLLNVRALDNRSADLSDEIVVPSSTNNDNQRQPCRGVPVPTIYNQ